MAIQHQRSNNKCTVHGSAICETHQELLSSAGTLWSDPWPSARWMIITCPENDGNRRNDT
jgi:hypothetical protein